MATPRGFLHWPRLAIGLVFLSVFFFPLNVAEADKHAEDLQKKVAELLKNRSLRGAEVGVVVRSMKTRKNVFEKNANLLLNPASNVKLITTLAALHILKPEYRFKTAYMTDGKDLVVKGYGDPSVTTERLRNVAHQLKLRGLHEVTGDLVLDDTYFDGVHYAKGQDAEKNNSKIWAAPVSALSLNRNGFEVFVRPTEVGQPAFVSVEPSSRYFTSVGEVKTGSRGVAPRISLASHPESMTVQMSGMVSHRLEPRSFFKRVTNPKAYFGESFRVILENEGIRVKGAVRSGVASASARSLYLDVSPRLYDVVSETNKISSNFMAEMLVKAIGATVSTPASFEDGLKEIRRFLEEKVGLKRGEYVLGNGSGLNQVNRFSASQLVKVLEFAQKDFEIASEFMSSLSVAGTQGTLTRRMKDPLMQRHLRGKTGTLRGVSALSGYLSGEGDDILTFAILFDGHRSSAHKMWQIQDEISRKLARNLKIVDQADLDLENQGKYDEGDGDGEDEEGETLAGGG